ncbi:MAG: diphthine--ammonia ligase [Nitrosopumilus sp.]|uniref:diphthine--ammonia ligase n=1 Tax=Nitrosopumilus sp. TaxID=2024843 RepID=UPI00247DBFFB|nr:diphthine--ammonia ligase [Nitrosopumilus sp.]MCV0391795.1 diphthine--ammonia ligase [Nitrosopumilus sp.]
MKLASLFSGGKDSTFAIYLAEKQGHEISCLLSVFPKSDESHLLHYPNLKWTKLQSESMKIPQLIAESNSDETDNELFQLEKLLQNAKEQFGIEGLVHGGIKSKFQYEKFESLCSKLHLTAITPLWNLEPIQYMNDLVDSNFEFILTTVTSDGLDDSWLGKVITKNDIEILQKHSEKYGFNLNFEGGEAETFVINCPMFLHSIKIKEFKKTWDGYRGRFEIVDAGLDFHA